MSDGAGSGARASLPASARARAPAASWIVGVDLAWGERRRDGVCFVERRGARASVVGSAYPLGDAELLAALATRIPSRARALVAIDAPIVCPNPTGARTVDRLTHRLFHREHAGCHPANATRCRRPPRVAAALGAQGFAIGHELRSARRLVAEVYPHPALVRWLGLSRIVKYKRGPAAARRAEFARLQRGLRWLAAERFPFLALDGETRALLAAPWSKPVEDLVDAFACALIGLWHVHHRGRRSEVIGDLASGFLLLPEDPRAAAAQGVAPRAASSARRAASASASGTARLRATSAASKGAKSAAGSKRASSQLSSAASAASSSGACATPGTRTR